MKTLAPQTITEDQIIGRSTANRQQVTCPSCDGCGRTAHRMGGTVVCGRCVSYGTAWIAA